MKKCLKCIIPANFPGIKFDENGLCNLCRFPKFKSAYPEDEIEFYKLKNDLEKINNRYNALICYSGGKDSTYTLIQTVKKYKMNPLVMTLDNGFISTKAKENIELICSSLGTDLITIRPNAKTMNTIFKNALTKKLFSPQITSRLSSACFSCINLVLYNALEIAIEKNISFIISGFTHGQVPKAVFNYNFEIMRSTYENLMTSFCTNDNERKLYPNIFKLENADKVLYNINPLLFTPYNENKIIEAITPYGWVKPKDVDSCSTNCLMNKIGNHYHFKLYGYHPYQYEISSLIRLGSMSIAEGEEALKLTVLDKGSQEIIKRLDIPEMCHD